MHAPRGTGWIVSWPRIRLTCRARGFRGSSRSGHVTLDGKPAKPGDKVRKGAVVTLTEPPAEPSLLEPEDIPLDVLYEDADLLVINKPPGLVVHPAAGHARHTLVHALLAHCAHALGDRRRAAPGHRPPAGQGHERLPGGGEERCGARTSFEAIRGADGDENLSGAGAGLLCRGAQRDHR